MSQDAPTSHSERPGRLTADGGDPLVEIFVIAPELRTIATGTGHLEVELPPGIYKVAFKAGSYGGAVYQDELVKLESGALSPVVRPSQRLLISSPVPAHGTATTHEYHRNPLREISVAQAKPFGSGSHLVVFVRDLEGSLDDNPLAGLTLHAIDSTDVLVDLEREAEVFRDVSSGYGPGSSEASAACHLELNPGCYRLRVNNSPSGAVEQILVTALGWQTQIFIPRRQAAVLSDQANRSSSPRAWADLGNAAVLMARAAEGIDFDNPQLSLTEKARLALSDRRWRVGPKALREMLDNAWENPMLGIYGAHLLLLSPEPDVHLLDETLRRLDSWVPEHPDVRALALWRATHEGREQTLFDFRVPPALKLSWHLIRTAASRREDLVPVSSLSALIAGRELCDTMWLLWDANHLDAPSDAAPAADLSLVADLGLLPGFDALSYDALEPLEQEIVRYVRTVGRSANPEELLQALGIPTASVRLVLGKLLEKASSESARMELTPWEAEEQERSVLEKALGLGESSLDAIRRLAGIYARREQWHIVAELLERAAAIEPTNRELLLELTDVYNKLGDSLRASETLQRIVESYGGHRTKELGEVHRRLAELYLGDGDVHRATEELEEAFRIEPGSIEVLKSLGDAALTIGDLPRAQRMFRALLLQKLDEGGYISKREVLMRLARAHEMAGDAVEAMQMYELALGSEVSAEALLRLKRER